MAADEAAEKEILLLREQIATLQHDKALREQQLETIAARTSESSKIEILSAMVDKLCNTITALHAQALEQGPTNSWDS